ncbi:MAG: hypothetical protein ACRCX2_26595 [Paraclostridium sp.]
MTVKEIKYELEVTKKFVDDFAYTSNLTFEEKREINLYRAELVALLNVPVGQTLGRPQRPPVFDRYN